MICAACGADLPAPAENCSACAAPTLLDGRYRLEALLGRGGFGVTYRATRVSDGRVLCVKELVYRRMGSFEIEERFRREAEILRQLDHAKIPKYVDDFVSGAGKALALYLVQEFVDGRSLAEELVSHRYHEDEVLAILEQLLEVLGYLHALSPPVVHRDVKPANVMRRAGSDELVLVDFGSVKDTLRESTVGGSSAGTFGYMAPEQLYGKASPASDLYGLGALAVALLSRREPAELVDDAHQLDWKAHVEVRPATARLLESLLDANPRRRASRAADVLADVRDARRAPVSEPPPKPARQSPAPPKSAPPESERESLESEPPESEPPRVHAHRRHRVRPPASPARTEPAPMPGGVSDDSSSVVIKVFAVGFALLALLGYAMFSPSSSSSSSSHEANVPMGLLGLRFGMSVAEAQRALPEIALTKQDRPSARAPYPELKVRTILLDEPATCDLDFGVAEGLSKIECAIDPFATKARHDEVMGRMLAALRKSYGNESSSTKSDEAATTSWSWDGKASSLYLNGHYEILGLFGFPAMPGSSPQSSLHVTNTSSEHSAAEYAREQKQRAAEGAKRDEAARELERKRAEELERLRKLRAGETSASP